MSSTLIFVTSRQVISFHNFKGLEFLVGLIGSNFYKPTVALYKLANKAMTLSPMDAAPPSSTPHDKGTSAIEIPCYIIKVHITLPWTVFTRLFGPWVGGNAAKKAIFAELIGAGRYECPLSSCGNHGPVIRFPFRLKDHQLAHCGYPGFDLYCDEMNQTVLELPSSVKLLVKNISYKSQEIHVYDHHDCLPRFLPYPDLSASPFQIKPYDQKDYTLFNCSPTNSYTYGQISCLSSGLGYQTYHVHAVPSDSFVFREDLLSCVKIYNISSPPYDKIEQKNVFPLNWSKPICGHCETKGKKCGLKKNNSTEPETGPETECFGKSAEGATFAFILLVLGLVLLYRAHRLDKIEKGYQVKIEKFLEDYRALKPTRYSYADIKRITNQFKEKLGQGGYGTVFKGKLSNEILVAVKMLNNLCQEV
ncbi:hypothetical protein L1049_020445 [Liquidambar formosana]|uniref:RING-type E3 ubiquitin transferase n=1 Tax=Liquidambar formosana TaxID=63359 RepID=A0AAP0SCS0_LIQFO